MVLLNDHLTCWSMYSISTAVDITVVQYTGNNSLQYIPAIRVGSNSAIEINYDSAPYEFTSKT